ncbi:hypothetical protein J1605_009318 [Eschrichtius robustus]|uniref:C2 domain-containing protein n=1 Tax=Eschrichtius robustus TaxID=9764 RepID=A0AB34GX70_ESCRO|nr:hypothetical protein J1605_009318 [Eschrichtius robustus]
MWGFSQGFPDAQLTAVPRPSPFYGEDFYCEIPRSFRHLSFYIFDRDVFRRDSIIGRYRPTRCFLHFLRLF